MGKVKLLKNGNLRLWDGRVITQQQLREMHRSADPAERLRAVNIMESLLRMKYGTLSAT